MRKKLIGSLLVFLLAGPVISARAEDRIQAGPAIRKVSIAILVDRELLEGSYAGNVQAKIEAEQVKAKIRKIVSEGSKVYEKEFGITFFIEAIKPWDFPKSQSEINADSAILDVATIASEERADITIGFVKKPMFKCRPGGKDQEMVQSLGCAIGEKRSSLEGYAYVLGNAAIIELDHDDGIFMHEVGHIFGAEHTSENSIMNDGKIGLSFDAANRNIILRNRNRTFEKIPLP